ncbi:serine/threonine protein kinase [Ramlibacter agri]|uniref:serine/threonine protein kinase n=1 Tax=Ramlibacter agri TaxID=2728837 RepID=UPI00197D6186|nr:serine/threonine protein kinase [Ramlibacter agri]
MPKQQEPRDGMPRTDKGDGSGKVGVTSDRQPDLVPPSGANQGDHGVADDRPDAGGELQFDDGTDMVHPRGKVTEAGRTWDDKKPSDAGELGAPNPGMSDRNGPSDPDAKRGR